MLALPFTLETHGNFGINLSKTVRMPAPERGREISLRAVTTSSSPYIYSFKPKSLVS